MNAGIMQYQSTRQKLSGIPFIIISAASFGLAAVVILSRNELRREKLARAQVATDSSGGTGDENVEAQDERFVAARSDS